jgi:hypothetical protein
MSESLELVAAIRRVYDINRLKVSVNPEFLANGAMEIIRFDKSIHPTGWVGCNLHLRQVARAFCRRNFLPEERALATAARSGAAIPGLFDDDLQDRYPRRTHPEQEPEYVLRDHLSEDDRWFNIDRMRSAAGTLLGHADALQTETVTQFGPRKDEAA